MKFECTFKGSAKKMEAQDEILEFCQQRLEKLERIFSQPLHAKMTISVEKLNQVADLKIDGNNVHFSSHGEAIELHLAIEMAIERMAKQITSKKGKMSDRIRKKEKHEHTLIELAEHREKSIEHQRANALLQKKVNMN